MEQIKEGLRSDFLTILCVLTFIGSGIGVLSGINNYREADLTSALMREQMQRSREEVKEKTKDAQGAEFADKIIDKTMAVAQPEKIKQFSIAAIICNLITFAGAALMFRLRKSGFWVYVLGTLALVVSPFFIYGSGNFLSWGMSFVMGLIGVIFILLYARNRRLMH